jgi:Fic family protein
MRQALSELEKYLHIAPHGPPAPGQEPDPTLAPLLIRIALAHYQFETIHPFRDGNGRVGRLLIPLLLISHGRLREPLLYMSAYLERHRDAYYDLMLRVSQAGAWQEWIDFFLRGVAESARESVDLAGTLLGLRDRWQQQFQSARSSALLLKLIDRLFQVPSITIGRAAEALKVTPAAAANNVGKLVDAAVLVERTGKRRGQVFVAMDIVRIVESARKGRKAASPGT